MAKIIKRPKDTKGKRRRGVEKVQVAGYGVQGAGYWVQGAGCRVQGAGCRVQGARCRVRGAGWGASSLAAGYGV